MSIRKNASHTYMTSRKSNKICKKLDIYIYKTYITPFIYHVVYIYLYNTKQYRDNITDVLTVKCHTGVFRSHSNMCH